MAKTERQQKLEDAKDFIRTTVQMKLRSYKRRAVDDALERLDVFASSVDDGGRLMDPMEAARLALKQSEQKYLSA